MRINKFLAQQTGLSRRAADTVIANGEVMVNDKLALLGTTLNTGDRVTYAGKSYSYAAEDQHRTLVMLNKPVGYVCSRAGQGSKTIYQLLPPELHTLKPVGRLDKDSSGLLLLTDDGDLAYQHTHPKFGKEKIYEVELDKPLTDNDRHHLEQGVHLDDGISRLVFRRSDQKYHTVSLSEGRNRQIRRTFASIGYKVLQLHRTSFGPYHLADLDPGKYKRFVV